MTTTKQERATIVNAMICVIGSRGRRFFYSKTKDRFAIIEVDSRGRVFWHDDYTGSRIYTHRNHRWDGFSHGGTLRNLVEHFRDYIMTGKPLKHGFGPWPDTFCDGDLWGYGKDAMQHVRLEAVRLGILKP